MENQDTKNERGFDSNPPTQTNVTETNTPETGGFQAPVTAQSSGFTGTQSNNDNSGENIKVQAPKQTTINTQIAIPNSGGILTLGILSIVMLCCCGPFLVGPVLGIIAIAIAPGAIRKYNLNPEKYKAGSLSNIKAGRVCAIIGLSLGIILFLFWLLSAGLDTFGNIDGFEEIYKDVWNEVGY